MFGFLEIKLWLTDSFPFLFSNWVILAIICLVLIFLVLSRWGFKFSQLVKILFFSLIILIFLLLCIGTILTFGSYFYYNLYPRIDHPKIEKDAFRILFIGESSTAGVGLNNNSDAYPAQVEKILQQKYPDKKIKSYNEGAIAIHSDNIKKNLDKNLITYQPHLVIIMAGSSDVFKMELNPLGPPYKFLDPQPQTFYNLESIVQDVRSYGSEIWFIGYLQPDAGEKLNPVLKKVAEKNNITYLEDYPKVEFEANSSLFVDGWHPSTEGHKIIADTIIRSILDKGVIDRWKG